MATDTASPFVSEADDLVADCHNGPITDVFVRDLDRVKPFISGAVGGRDGGNRSRAPSISADGRWVAFESAAPTWWKAMETTGWTCSCMIEPRTHRRVSARLEARSAPDLEPGVSRNPALTADGQWIFDSENALVTDDTNGQRDVYRYRVSTGTWTG